MTINYTKILLVVLIVSLFSCEKQEEVHKTKFFLHGLLIEGEKPKIKVCRTLETFNENPFNLLYYDELYYYDEEANNDLSLIINKDGVAYNDVEKVNFYVKGIPSSIPSALYNGETQYFTFNDMIIEPGNSFEINADISERNSKVLLESLSAKTKIPERIVLDLKKLPNRNHEVYGDERTFYTYNLSFQDIPNQDDYYYLLAYRIVRRRSSEEENIDFNNVNLDSLWMEYENHDDYDYPSGDYSFSPLSNKDSKYVRINGLEMDDVVSLSGELFDDHLFDGNKKELIIEIADYYKPYLVFELYHVNEEFYRYYYSLVKQNDTQLDIYSEPVQLYTNIDNGLGVFAGASVSRQIVKIE